MRRSTYCILYVHIILYRVLHSRNRNENIIIINDKIKIIINDKIKIIINDKIEIIINCDNLCWVDKNKIKHAITTNRCSIH